MLKFRIISSCLMGAAFLVAVQWLPAIGLWLLALALALACQREFYGMARESGVRPFAGTGLLCGALWISAVFLGARQAGAAALRWEQGLAAAITLMIFLRVFFGKNHATPLASVAMTLLGVGYVPLLLSYLLRLAFLEESAQWLTPLDTTGRRVVLYAVVVVKCSDIGAYTAGRLFGRHKLFPRLSPKKTWEGLAGGLVSAALASVVFSLAGGGALGVLAFSLPHALALGVLLALAGVAGDLFESQIKRAAGVKDSSALIPGNGGVLDVFDSLLFAAPVMHAYAVWALGAG